MRTHTHIHTYIYIHICMHTCSCTSSQAVWPEVVTHTHTYSGDARQLMAEVEERDIPEAGFRITYQMNTDEKKFTAIVRHFVRERVRLGMKLPDVIYLNTGVCACVCVCVCVWARVYMSARGWGHVMYLNLWAFACVSLARTPTLMCTYMPLCRDKWHLLSHNRSYRRTHAHARLYIHTCRCRNVIPPAALAHIYIHTQSVCVCVWACALCSLCRLPWNGGVRMSISMCVCVCTCIWGHAAGD